MTPIRGSSVATPPTKSRAHTTYRTADNTIVPGVTTALNVLAKPALVPWANKLGLQGIDSSKYVDALAQIGTLAHHMIECYLSGVTPDLSDYTTEQIDKAENSVLSYHEWAKGHAVEPILTEAALVSEELRYGGTIDCYAGLDGVPTLIDFKTSRAIWPEHLYQVAAYDYLLLEHGYDVGAVMILQIGRDETEGFSTRTVTDRTPYFEVFEHCLAIYKLKKITERR